MNAPLVIIGGGLSGLACARMLSAAGRESLVIEASDDVGGRARTDVVQTADGRYLLDCGFQVLLTAYPEARHMLDLDALKLRPFYSGADVWCEGAMHRIANPFRHPLEAVKSFQSPVTTLTDKAVLGKMYASSTLTTLDGLRARPETTTLERLRSEGLSDRAIDRFFRPFFGGVFFDRELATSSRMFDFVFKMFASGEAAVPAGGMGQIARQIADGLPAHVVQLSTRAVALRHVQSGIDIETVSTSGTPRTIHADACVIATEGDSARSLMAPEAAPINVRWVGTTTLWYALAGPPPTDAPILMLNGESTEQASSPKGSGPVNHLAIVSNAAPSYAPSGRALVAANIVGVPTVSDDELDRRVRAQLTHWFAADTSSWERLRVQRIPRALPDVRVAGQGSRVIPSSDPTPKLSDRLFICGDHRSSGSIDAAIRSGRLVAEALLG
ncbi:MAG: FAD-dependent oxidoreductase [Phycisphaerales bacterium]|nr:FAD-dependent oxidoreductase [Phycisphaerales bacterium]